MRPGCLTIVGQPLASLDRGLVADAHGLTTRTGHGARCTTFMATLPSATRAKPWRAWVPTTTTDAGSFRAKSTIPRAGSTSRRTALSASSPSGASAARAASTAAPSSGQPVVSTSVENGTGAGATTSTTQSPTASVDASCSRGRGDRSRGSRTVDRHQDRRCGRRIGVDVRSDEQDRVLGAADDRLGHASEHGFAEPAAPVRRHADRRSRVLPGHEQDRVRRSIVVDDGGIHLGVGQLGRPSQQVVAEVRLRPSPTSSSPAGAARRLRPPGRRESRPRPR